MIKRNRIANNVREYQVKNKLTLYQVYLLIKNKACDLPSRERKHVVNAIEGNEKLKGIKTGLGRL